MYDYKTERVCENCGVYITKSDYTYVSILSKHRKDLTENSKICVARKVDGVREIKPDESKEPDESDKLRKKITLIDIYHAFNKIMSLGMYKRNNDD